MVPYITVPLVGINILAVPMSEDAKWHDEGAMRRRMMKRWRWQRVVVRSETVDVVSQPEVVLTRLFTKDLIQFTRQGLILIVCIHP